VSSRWLALAFALGGAIVVSTLSGDARHVLVGGVLGYLLARGLGARARIEELEQRVAQLESREPVPEAVTPPPAPAPRTAPTTVAPPPVAPAPAQEIQPAAPTPAPEASPWTPPPPSRLETLYTEAAGRALAWIKGGNPIARAGIVVLFFGGAFLAKYASDHALLPLELRLAALAAGAIGLLGLGWRLRAQRRMYAQILQGGGIAGLYLTVFAATRLYGLLPPGFSLPLLIVIALASAVLAVSQRALALAVIGFAGGFLAPVLLSTGGGNHVALFSYYTVLNLGVFAVAWFRAWRVLNLVGFVFTFTITGAWRALSYRPDQLASADFFLLLFFVLYVAISILFALRQKPDLRGYVSGSLVFGLPVVAFSLHASLVSRIEYGLAWSALGFGLFYVTLAWALWRSRIANLALLVEAFAALGVIFASLAIPLAFDQQTTAAMWAVEGAGLLWIGVRQQRRLARAFGALLQLGAGIGYLAGLPELRAATPVLNSAYIGTLLLAVSGALTAHWLQRSAAARTGYERGADVAAALWASAWWWYGGLAEIERNMPEVVDYGLALDFAAASLVATVLLGRRWQWDVPLRLAVAQLPLALVAGIAVGADLNHPFAEFGAAGWLALLAAAGYVLWDLDRAPDALLAPATPFLHGGLYCVIALLAAWEIHWRLDGSVPGVWDQLAIGLVPALLVWVATTPRAWLSWPLARHYDAYLLHGAAPLAGVAALWLLGMNFGSAGDPGWLPYWPLLNPLDIASVLVLLTLAHWWLGVSPRRETLGVPAHAPWIVLAVLAFVWLNAALIRAQHYAFDTPLDFHGIRRSVPVQASLSIFWSLLGIGAMTLASRRRWRAIWIAGAGLMGVVVLKLFAIDLEGTGTLARIVSFLTVGGLLLAAGYLSPLPPDSAEKARA
jgi:uncharacterized membrane protein